MTIRNGRSYTAYINSSSWEKRRELYFSTHPKKCITCGAKEDIHLHHKTYARMGSERDDDLAALCEFCHSTLHRFHKQVGGSLLDASNAFISEFDKPAPRGRKRKPRSEFVPRNLRGAATDGKGRKVSKLDWRDEVRNIRTDKTR